MKNEVDKMISFCQANYLSIFDEWDDRPYCWIAGGAVRDFFLDKTPRDVDFYFATPEDRDAATKFLIKKGFKHTASWRKHGDHGARGHDCLQRGDLLYETFYTQPKPTMCIDEFDFTVCACAIDIKQRFFHHEKFFDHLQDKEIHLITPALIDYQASAIRELQRLYAFIHQGYTIDTKNLLIWLKRTVSIEDIRHHRWDRVNNIYTLHK